MINPDMRAIVFSFLIADLTITLFMILLAVQNHRRFRGIRFWVAAFLLQNIGVILIELRGSIPDWSSFVLSNAMIIAGVLAGLKGMCSFSGVKMNHIPGILVLILFTAVQAWFSLVEPDLPLRNVNLGVAMLLLSLQYIWLIFRRVSPSMRNLASGVGMVYIGYAVVNLLRIVNYFTGHSTSGDYFQAGPFERPISKKSTLNQSCFLCRRKFLKSGKSPHWLVGSEHDAIRRHHQYDFIS